MGKRALLKGRRKVLGLALSPTALMEVPEPNRRCGEPPPTAFLHPAKLSAKGSRNHCGIRSDDVFCRVGISLDAESPDPHPLLSSEWGSRLKPPKAKHKRKVNGTRIRTRVQPDPGSASAVGEEKPYKTESG